MTQPAQYGIYKRDLIIVEPSHEPNVNLAIGLRKMARFNYEDKGKRFYDGSEEGHSQNTNVGPVSGWEYLFEFSNVRQTGREARNQRYFLRYLADWWIVENDFVENGLADVLFYSQAIKLRKKIGTKVNLTGGLKTRVHPAYSVAPVEDYLQGKAWWQLANEYGYDDRFIYNDFDANGEYTMGEWSDYEWINSQGEIVAATDEEFRTYYLPGIFNRYNKEVRDTIPYQSQISASIGLDVYHYSNDFWLHAFGEVLPWHQEWGNAEYSYERLIGGSWVDFKAGLVVGIRLGKQKRLGVFSQGSYNRYWNREWYGYTTGINFILK